MLNSITIDDALSGDVDDGSQSLILTPQQASIIKNMMAVEAAKLIELPTATTDAVEFKTVYEKLSHQRNVYQYLLNLSEENKTRLKEDNHE